MYDIFILGWLQPLLQRLKENPKLLVIPLVGAITHDTFEYYSSNFFLHFGLSMSFDFYLYQQMSPYKKEYYESLQRGAPVR